jgi:hypothetical protein
LMCAKKRRPTWSGKPASPALPLSH